MARRTATLVLAALAGATLWGCGSDPGPLATAADHLAELDAAEMDLELETVAADGSRVGFAVRGPFSVPEEGGVPVAQLDTKRRVGGEVESATVVLTGGRGYVVAGGSVHEVPEAAMAPVVVPGDGDGPVALRLDDWIEDPEVQDRDGGRTVRGPANVRVVVADLLAMARGFDAAAVLPDVGGERGERLEAAVTSSEVQAVLDGDGRLRSLTAELVLGEAGGAPLGEVAPVTISLRLELRPLDGPLEVEVPSG